jgi:hypothetical protein
MAQPVPGIQAKTKNKPSMVAILKERESCLLKDEIAIAKSAVVANETIALNRQGN